MKLYKKNGYLNIEGLLEQPFVFNFIVGGRGTGKTYGILEYALKYHKKIFMIRRTQAQAEIVGRKDFNPFRPIDPDITVQSESKYHSAFYQGENCVGYIAGLSTFAKIRGFDASDIDIMFYDEFIPELHETKLKHEDLALMNAYETVNRNRELAGRPAVKLVCAANSNRIDNIILQRFRLLNPLQKMMKSGKEIWTDPERSVQLVFLSYSPISSAKSRTAIYNAVGSGEFTDMSIGNRFAEMPDNIISRNLKEYKILFRTGDLGVYASRSGQLKFYVCPTKETPSRIYDTTEKDKKRLKAENPFLMQWIISGLFEFESLDVYTEFMDRLT